MAHWLEMWMWWLIGWRCRCGGSLVGDVDVVAHWLGDVDVVAHWLEVWWLIGWRCGGSLVSAPDFWGRGPGFESVISHNDPDALQDHCVIM